MIDKNKLLSWKYDDDNLDFDMFVVEFDDTISKDQNSRIISEIFKDENHNFIAMLQDKKFSWYPDFFKDKFPESKYILEKLHDYTSLTLKDKNYYGDILIKDLNDFLQAFLDYPTNFSYQDIEIYSQNENLVLNISNHGNLWIISDKSIILDELKIKFRKSNFKIIETNINK